MKGGTSKSRMLWTFAVTSLALVMVTLDNLVVTTALPVIRKDLGAGIESLEWTVNAYTLTFAVLLLTGAALRARFARPRMLPVGAGRSASPSAAAGCARGGWRPAPQHPPPRRSPRRSTHSSPPARRRASAV